MAELQALQAIPMNPRYHAGLATFKTRCNDYQATEQYLESVLHEDVLGLTSSLKSKSGARIADIGCGDGTITQTLCTGLLDRCRGTVELDIIEPTERYRELTSRRLQSLAQQRLAFELRATSAEGHFLDKETESLQYDLVFGSHVFHLVDPSVLKSVLSRVCSGGYLWSIVGSRVSLMSTLKDLFAPSPSVTGDEVRQAILDAAGTRDVVDVCTLQRSVLALNEGELPRSRQDLSEPVKNLLSLMFQRNVDDLSDADFERGRDLIVERIHGGKIELEWDGQVYRID